jgi:hypothetical protein
VYVDQALPLVLVVLGAQSRLMLEGRARALSGPSPDLSRARDHPSLAVSSGTARDRREESVPCISIQVTCRPGTGSSLKRTDMGSTGLFRSSHFGRRSRGMKGVPYSAVVGDGDVSGLGEGP